MSCDRSKDIPSVKGIGSVLPPVELICKMKGLILVLLSDQGKKSVIRAYKDLILNFKGHWFTVCSHTGIDGNKVDGAWRKVKSRISDNPGPCHRSEEHTSELQSRGHLVCRLLLEKKK